MAIDPEEERLSLAIDELRAVLEAESSTASPTEVPHAPLTDGSKARVQLEADFLNGMALNIQAVGTLGPLAAWIFADSFSAEKAFLGAAMGILCFVGSFALHLVASLGLRRLDGQ